MRIYNKLCIELNIIASSHHYHNTSILNIYLEISVASGHHFANEKLECKL